MSQPLRNPFYTHPCSAFLLHPTEDCTRTLRESASARFAELHGRDALFKRSELHQRREAEHQQWKRDLSGRTIDTLYGCFLLNELIDYAVNFTFPWTNGEFDVYDVPDATNPEPFKNASTFFNDDRTRCAPLAHLQRLAPQLQLPLRLRAQSFSGEPVCRSDKYLKIETRHLSINVCRIHGLAVVVKVNVLCLGNYDWVVELESLASS
ncbi:hypothetical protein C8J57DRAFT_1538450 [Mycena rebaudengoi]|nr:hypothetical protein C8J57DRAFT_1538450 [Mycena rebaudengoi]